MVAYVLALSVRATPPGWLIAVGVVTVLAGGVLALGGLVSLGRNLTPYPQPVDGGVLVDRGVYAWVRHPIYGGIVLGALGIALAVGSWLAAFVAAGLLAFFWLKATHEELRLVAAYPSYREYQSRVPKVLIPWVI